MNNLLSAALNFRLAYTQLRTETNHVLEEFDLTPLEWATLQIVQALNEASLGQIARQLSIAPPAASNLIHKLSEAQLVMYRPSQQDRRKKHVCLTDCGADTLSKATKAVTQLMEQVFSDSSEEEIKTFQSVCTAIIISTRKVHHEH